MTPPSTVRSGPRNPRDDLDAHRAYFDAVPYDPSKEEKEQVIVEPEVVENNAAKEVLAGSEPTKSGAAEPKVDESNAAKEVPAASEPPKSGAAEPDVKENSTATKVPAASCECIINSLTSSVREEMKCVSVCHLFFDLFRTEGTEKERRKGKLDMLLIGAIANVLTCRVRVSCFVLRGS